MVSRTNRQRFPDINVYASSSYRKTKLLEEPAKTRRGSFR